MEVKNYSNRNLVLPHQIKNAEKVIILPDYCPGSGVLSTGWVVAFNRSNHTPTYEFLGADVGCGMRLVDIGNFSSEFIPDISNRMAEYFLKNPNGLGSLGKGNHFLTFYKSESADKSYALIHSGSRNKGIEFFATRLKGDEYLVEHKEVIDYASENRLSIQRKLEEIIRKKVVLIVDAPHNFLENTEEEEFIYRKGAAKVLPGEKHVISSSMGGDALIVTGNFKLDQTMNSFCHGTGRRISLSDARKELFFTDPNVLGGIYFPYFLPIDHFTTELPPCYRDLDEIKPFIKKYSKINDRLIPLASVMI